MSKPRVLLAWLCGALLLVVGLTGGMRTAAGRRASAGACATPCCLGGECRCGDDSSAAAGCGCGPSRRPEREPALSTPRPAPLTAPDLERRPRTAAAASEPKAGHAGAPVLRTGLLPRVARQEALCVWRC